MPSREQSRREHVLDRLLEFEQAYSVGNSRAIFPGFFSHLLLRQMEIVGQLLKGVRLLDGIEVLALEIFDQRHLERGFFGHVADNDRYAAHLRSLCRSPTALARNQLIATSYSSHHEWLHDSAGPDGLGELV